MKSENARLSAATSVTLPDAMLYRLRDFEQPFHMAVTGGCHVGKTTWLKSFFSAICDHALVVDGFIEEAVFDHGTRIGYDFRDLLTHVTIPVARRISPDTRYTFYNDAWDFAAAILHRSRQGSILIVDELGLLEAHGGGLMPFLIPVLTKSRCHLIASVRQSVFAEIEHQIGAFDHVITLASASEH